MDLLLISGQKSQTLLEFYSPKKWPKEWREMPEMMTALITTLGRTELINKLLSHLITLFPFISQESVVYKFDGYLNESKNRSVYLF